MHTQKLKQSGSDPELFKKNPDVMHMRMHEIFLMKMEGRTNKYIAKHFNVTPKTISRWLKRACALLDISIHDQSCTKAFILALEEHGILIMAKRRAMAEAREAGHFQLAAGILRSMEKSYRNRDKAVETFGIKFKDKTESENVQLKTMNSGLLIIINRLEANRIASEKSLPVPFPQPFTVSESTIKKFRRCPNLSNYLRYVRRIQIPSTPRYMGIDELETLTLIHCVSDPLFDPKNDNMVDFVFDRILSLR